MTFFIRGNKIYYDFTRSGGDFSSNYCNIILTPNGLSFARSTRISVTKMEAGTRDHTNQHYEYKTAGYLATENK